MKKRKKEAKRKSMPKAKINITKINLKRPFVTVILKVYSTN
jgi:hypothetical protein